MANTQFAHRCLLICPASRVAAMRTYWDASVDPGQGANAWNVPLNASGSAKDPPTAYWISMALTEADLASLIKQLASTAKLPTVKDSDIPTKAQKTQWVADNQAAVLGGAGILVVRDDQEKTWSDPDAALALLGLKRIQAALP